MCCLLVILCSSADTANKRVHDDSAGPTGGPSCGRHAVDDIVQTRTDGRTGEARGRRRSTDRSPGPSTAGRVPGPSPGPRRPRPRRPSTEDDLITGGRLLLGGRAPRRLEMTAELTTRRLAWTFAAKEDRGVRTSRDPSASSSSTTARG